MTTAQEEMVRGYFEQGLDVTEAAIRAKVSEQSVGLFYFQERKRLGLPPPPAPKNGKVAPQATEVSTQEKGHSRRAFSIEKIAEIRRLHAEGVTYKQICEKLDVSYSAVNRYVQSGAKKPVATSKESLPVQKPEALPAKHESSVATLTRVWLDLKAERDKLDFDMAAAVRVIQMLGGEDPQIAQNRLNGKL